MLLMASVRGILSRAHATHGRSLVIRITDYCTVDQQNYQQFADLSVLNTLHKSEMDKLRINPVRKKYLQRISRIQD